MFVAAGRVFDRILDLCALAAGVIVAFIVISISYGVFARYVLHAPISWTIEINEYALLFVTFLAAPWVLHHEKHVRVDIVLDFLKPRVKAGLLAWNSVVGIVVSLLIAYYGTLVAIDLIERDVRNATLLEVPKGPLVAIVPFGCLLLGVEFFRRGLSYLKIARGVGEVTAMESNLDYSPSVIASDVRGDL